MRKSSRPVSGSSAPAIPPPTAKRQKKKIKIVDEEPWEVKSGFAFGKLPERIWLRILVKVTSTAPMKVLRMVSKFFHRLCWNLHEPVILSSCNRMRAFSKLPARFHVRDIQVGSFHSPNEDLLREFALMNLPSLQVLRLAVQGNWLQSSLGSLPAERLAGLTKLTLTSSFAAKLSMSSLPMVPHLQSLELGDNLQMSDFNALSYYVNLSTLLVSLHGPQYAVDEFGDALRPLTVLSRLALIIHNTSVVLPALPSSLTDLIVTFRPDHAIKRPVNSLDLSSRWDAVSSLKKLARLMVSELLPSPKEYNGEPILPSALSYPKSLDSLTIHSAHHAEKVPYLWQTISQCTKLYTLNLYGPPPPPDDTDDDSSDCGCFPPPEHPALPADFSIAIPSSLRNLGVDARLVAAVGRQQTNLLPALVWLAVSDSLRDETTPWRCLELMPKLSEITLDSAVIPVASHNHLSAVTRLQVEKLCSRNGVKELQIPLLPHLRSLSLSGDCLDRDLLKLTQCTSLETLKFTSRVCASQFSRLCAGLPRLRELNLTWPQKFCWLDGIDPRVRIVISEFNGVEMDEKDISPAPSIPFFV